MTQEYVPKVGDLIELLIQYDSDARETGIITDVNWSYHQWDKKEIHLLHSESVISFSSLLQRSASNE